MARPLTSLPGLGDAYRVDRHSPGFETKGFSKREDAKRARLIRNGIGKRGGLFKAKAAKELAKRLSYAGRGKRAPKSLASSLYMRRQRIRVLGHLWKLVSEQRLNRISRIDLVPRGWVFQPRQLKRVDPGKLLGALKTDLYRCGAAKSDGLAFIVLHGEFDPEAEVYQLHVHGLATGGMIDVIDKLRKRRKYRTGDGVKNRVEISRKKITNLAYRLTYLLKSYWPSRSIFKVDGERRRVRKTRRAPEPFHTHYLLWLDKHSLNDITLLIHVSAGKDGLVINHRRNA